MVWHFPASSLHRHKIDRKVRDVFLQVIRLSMDSFKLMLRRGVLHTLQWRHNGRDGHHHPRHCLLSCLFRRRSKKTSKLRVTGLCAGNSPLTGEFPAQMASKAENVPIWWRHHEEQTRTTILYQLPSKRGNPHIKANYAKLFQPLVVDYILTTTVFFQQFLSTPRGTARLKIRFYCQ